MERLRVAAEAEAAKKRATTAKRMVIEVFEVGDKCEDGVVKRVETVEEDEERRREGKTERSGRFREWREGRLCTRSTKAGKRIEP